jgi:hypothetical protein
MSSSKILRRFFTSKPQKPTKTSSTFVVYQQKFAQVSSLALREFR